MTTTARGANDGGGGGPALVGVACEPALRGVPHPYADRGVVRRLVLEALDRAGFSRMKWHRSVILCAKAQTFS